MTADDYARAAELISGADALLVCAGAGMGVDSGLPDFRGDEGFWRAYPPYERLGLSFVEIANPEHFAEDPYLAWGFYGHRLDLYRRTVPHKGFALLRDWGADLPGGMRVYTSNVDGQFQRAGFPEEHVAEVHGSIHHRQCSAGCSETIRDGDDLDVIVDTDTMRALPPLPRCPDCGEPDRPNILMFGDFDWVGRRSQTQLNALNEWRRAQRNLVTVELGAGNAVPTVRRFAELASAATGSLIRINPRESQVRHGRGISIADNALSAVTAIDALLAP